MHCTVLSRAGRPVTALMLGEEGEYRCQRGDADRLGGQRQGDLNETRMIYVLGVGSGYKQPAKLTPDSVYRCAALTLAEEGEGIFAAI